MELFYLCNEHKNADQLHGYHEADLRLCFAYADCQFSHCAAQIILVYREDSLSMKVSLNLLNQPA